MTNNCRPPLTNIHQTSAPLEQHPPFPPPLKTKDFQKSPPSDLSDLRRTSRDFVARGRPKQGSLRSPRGRLLVASLEKQQQQLNSVVLCVQRKKKKQMPFTVRCNMVSFRGRPRAFVFLSSELRAASDKVGSPIESFTPAIPAQIFAHS